MSEKATAITQAKYADGLDHTGKKWLHSHSVLKAAGAGFPEGLVRGKRESTTPRFWLEKLENGNHPKRTKTTGGTGLGQGRRETRGPVLNTWRLRVHEHAGRKTVPAPEGLTFQRNGKEN